MFGRKTPEKRHAAATESRQKHRGQLKKTEKTAKSIGSAQERLNETPQRLKPLK